MRDKLKRAIADCENHLKNDLTPISRKRFELHMEIFLSYQRLLNYLPDEALPHECCGRCKDLGKLAWNEGDEE